MHRHFLVFSAVFAVIALVLVGGFFYTQPAVAQTSSKLPDLTITKATLDGAALRFLYHNRGEGAAQPTVSFWYEWVDGQGRRIGNLYWINVGGMAGASKWEGNQLLDFSTLDWERGKIKLSDLVYNSPPGAYYLKLAIDGPNAYAESNEQNNSVLLPVLRTDFTITDAEFRNDFPWFKYHNRGNLGHPEGKKVAFWLEWVDARGARIGELHWLEVDPPSILSSRSASLTRSTSFDSTTTIFSAQGATKLTSFLNSAPQGADQLKITIDGPNAYAEFNEGNNSVLLTPKPEKLPDLALTGGSRAGGVVRVTIVNSTLDTLRLPFLQFKWLDAKGAVLGTSPVSYWTGANIASGKTGDFTIEYERWREDGVTRFLKHPPAGAVALLATIDPENKLKESNEDNNSFRIGLTSLAELEYGKIEVRSGVLVIEVRNSGTVDAVATDIWLQWYGKGKWLDAGGVLEVPAIAAGKIAVITVPLDRKFRDGGAHLSSPPKDGERLRLFLDGSRKVEELNEHNNDGWLERTALPASPAQVVPELSLTLLVKVLPSSGAAAAASNSTAGFLLALAVLLGSAHLIHAHNLPRGGKPGFLAILPMLFTSARSSYMRLQGCGPQRCLGPHFSSHQTLQGIARSSLLATAFTGVVKVTLAAALAALTPVAAGETIVYPGDRLEATLTAKNTGTERAYGVILALKCPSGSVRDRSARLNGREVLQDPEAGIGVSDLEPGQSHQVAAVCKVTAEAVRLGQVEFSGSARTGQIASPFVSNTVRLAVKERPKPQPEAVPQDKADLVVEGMGFLPLLDIVEATNQPLPAIFSAYVKNSGAKSAPESRARLRLDAGNNGNWDFTAPQLAEVPTLPAGEQTFIKIPFEWKAPIGAYAFEICTDALSAIAESNESNNCATDRFTLKVGEEPAQEEELIEE